MTKKISNMYKLVIRFVVLFCFFAHVHVNVLAKEVLVTSPDGTVKVTVGVKSCKPYYTVQYAGKTLIAPSHLGFQLDCGLLGDNVKLTGKRYDTKDETWTQPWGEEQEVRNHYNELTVSFTEKSSRQMDVVFRVFNDGVGLRYILPSKKQGEKYCILDELTEITLAHDAEAWSIPSNRTEYFEGIYTCDLLSKKDTVCTPLTIEYEDSLYLAIHEAALEDYASLNLAVRGAACLRAALTPWQSGVKVYCEGETKTPWRTIIIGKTAG